MSTMACSIAPTDAHLSPAAAAHSLGSQGGSPHFQPGDCPRCTSARRRLPSCLGPCPSSCLSSHCTCGRQVDGTRVHGEMQVVTCTTPLTAQDCSRPASSACYQWKWPLQHLNYSCCGRAFGLLRDQQYKGHHSHQTHMQWIHVSMHTTDPTHIGATPVWPCGSWKSFTEYAHTNPECRSPTETPQRTT